MRDCAKTFLTVLLICVFSAYPSGAQPDVVTAKLSIPFDFWIGGKKFPAGDYTLDSAVPRFDSIRGTDGKINQQIPTLIYAEPVNKADARVVFSRRNGKYYLSELWGVLGKRTITADYGRTPQKEDHRREVRLTYP